MHPVTQLLLKDLGRVHRFSRAAMCKALVERGVKMVPFENLYLRFEYQDDAHMTGMMAFGPEDRIAFISMTLTLPGDEDGWDAWSEKRERERLKRQSEWLCQKGYRPGRQGPMEIQNLYSARDGCSSIILSPTSGDIPEHSPH